jgi:hypothetical protein
MSNCGGEDTFEKRVSNVIKVALEPKRKEYVVISMVYGLLREWLRAASLFIIMTT